MKLNPAISILGRGLRLAVIVGGLRSFLEAMHQ